MFHGIANSTRRTYDSAQHKFLEFCHWSKCIPDHLIKTLGRWFSNAYQLYLQTPHYIIETIPARIVCNNNHNNNIHSFQDLIVVFLWGSLQWVWSLVSP